MLFTFILYAFTNFGMAGTVRLTSGVRILARAEIGHLIDSVKC